MNLTFSSPKPRVSDQTCLVDLAGVDRRRYGNTDLATHPRLEFPFRARLDCLAIYVVSFFSQ